jgi:hypothetical protein
VGSCSGTWKSVCGTRKLPLRRDILTKLARWALVAQVVKTRNGDRELDFSFP